MENEIYHSLDVLLDMLDENDLPVDERVFRYKKGEGVTHIHLDELKRQLMLRTTYRPSMIKRVN